MTLSRLAPPAFGNPAPAGCDRPNRQTGRPDQRAQLAKLSSMKINVTCHSGYRGEETPRSIQMGNNPIAVERVMDRWLSPDHRYFKILGDDGATYIIRHDMVSLQWELTFFKHTETGTGIEP